MNDSISGSLIPNKTTNVFSSGIPAIQANGDRLLLCIGIVYILQSYKVRKRVELIWKSLVKNGPTVSVQNLTFY